MERRDSYEDGLSEGLSQGRSEGLSESLSQDRINGEYSHRIHIVYNMFQKNISAESCAGLLDEDISFVNNIYRFCQTNPEWSEGDI